MAFDRPADRGHCSCAHYEGGFSSLVLGILTGTLIYTIGMDGNVLMGTLESAFTVMGNKVDFNILIFCSLLGALVYVVAMSGGTQSLRQLGRQAHQGPQERPGSHHGARRAHLHRRLLQLPHGGHGDASDLRPLQHRPCEARLHHRLDGRSGVHHRARFELGRRRRLLTAGLHGLRKRHGCVHRHDSLELLRAALPAAHRLHRRDRLRLRPDRARARSAPPRGNSSRRPPLRPPPSRPTPIRTARSGTCSCPSPP